MEPDGERRGGEAERRGRRKLVRLLEAIDSSEVLEKRIPLIKMLEGSSQFSADDLGLILQVLLASWIDSTCSGVSHCRLHRSILQVALKCSDLGITDYLGQFLTLGAKASSWCGKHIQWSVKSIDDELVQEEEHNRLRLEVNSLSFSISTKLFGIAAKCITMLELKVAAGEGGKVVWPEQECLLNKADTEFPTLNTMEVEVEHLAMELRTKSVRQMEPWSLLSPPPQEAPRRRCMHCRTENTPKWRPGPNGPGTLCNACGHPRKKCATAASLKNTLFREGQLLHSNTRLPPKKRCHSIKENYSAAGNDVGSSLDDFFDHTDPEESWEPESAEEKVLENKGAFPSVETMAGEVEHVLALDVPRARTKGRRRVTAIETTCRRANVRPHGDLRGEKAAAMTRRCTHCTAEKTPQWRDGPDGPHTLCNACGVVFKKKGMLLPEYRPATSPAFSPLLHSNSHSRALEMHRRRAVEMRRRKETAMMRRCTHCATEETPQWREGPEGPGTLCNACGVVFNKKGVLLPEYRPASSPAFSPLLHSNRYSRALEMHRRNGATSAACHGEGRSELMEGLLLPPANGPASFSMLQRHSLLRQSEEETSAAIGATSKPSPRHEFMEVQQQPFPERPPADRPAFSLVYHRRVLECHHKSEEETFAVICATAKALGAELAAARLATMDN